MEQEVKGVPASPSGCQPSASAAGASSQSGIPNAEAWHPLTELDAIADEIYERWDKDMRSGKLLLALGGDIPRYRADATSVRLALAVAPGMLATLGAIHILATRFEDQDPKLMLKNIADMCSPDDLARMFAEMPAQAIEARRAETQGGSVHESAVAKPCAQTPEGPHQ